MKYLPLFRHLNKFKLFQSIQKFQLYRIASTIGNMPSALVLLAEGAEEMETVIIVDVLRRADVDVTLAGLTGSDCTKCSRNVKICPDASLSSVKDKEYNVVILPGGLQGAESLSKSSEVGKLLKKQEAEGRCIAAICAAPMALVSHEIGKGKKVTSYPGLKDKITAGGLHTYLEDRVVKDTHLITSRGPGTALEFALAIAGCLTNSEMVEKLKKQLLFQ